MTWPNPPCHLLLCDEPTGALDYATGIRVLRLLVDLKRSLGKTVVLITHNGAIAPMADRVVRLRSGQVVEEHPINLAEARVRLAQAELHQRCGTMTSPVDGVVLHRFVRGSGQVWQVYAIRGGRVQLQEVTVGLVNDDAAEIVAGLAEGELAVLSPESTLANGTRVSPVVSAASPATRSTGVPAGREKGN